MTRILTKSSLLWLFPLRPSKQSSIQPPLWIPKVTSNIKHTRYQALEVDTNHMLAPSIVAPAGGDGLPPGTIKLIDQDGSIVGKDASGSDEADIVLIPRASDDPEDPLNWKKKRKWLATSCVLVYTIMIAIPSSAVYSVVTPIRTATGLSLSDINNGTGIMVRTLSC